MDTENPKIEMDLNCPGEIALRGPSIAKGYWNKPEANEKVFLDNGW